jgi:hypothetical protein
MVGARFLEADFMRKTLPARQRLFSLYAFIEQSTNEEVTGSAARVRRPVAKGVGILKVAKSLGIGTGTVQRISGERAMSLRGAAMSKGEQQP